MVGNVVYIIDEHMIREDVRQIHSVHATWDGVNRELHRLADINRDAGYVVSQDKNGEFRVYYAGRGLVYKYSISTRTIEE